MAAFWLAALGCAVDVLAFWLIWRARGRPLPMRLEWMRVHPATKWLMSLLEAPALEGL